MSGFFFFTGEASLQLYLMNILGHPGTNEGRMALSLVSQPLSIRLWEKENHIISYCLSLEEGRSYTGIKRIDAFEIQTEKTWVEIHF